jgi:hypothetical protein
MNIVRLKGVKPPTRQQLLVNVKAAKHARLFLKHLKPDRERLHHLDPRQASRHEARDWLIVGAFFPYPIETLPEEWRKIVEQIDKMQAVESDVRALLDIPYPFPDRRNAARFIGEAAIKAWCDAGEKPPLSPTGPLCLFVTLALAAVGYNYAESHVSDMLRDRHNRPRSGKARS